MTETITNPPVGSIWRQEDGYLIRVVLVKDGRVWVKAANGRGNAWQVLPAWFSWPVDDGGWERTS